MVEKKKELEKKETKEDNKNSSSGKELYWVLGIMVGLIAVFLISSYYFQGQQNFEYHGLDFSKQMLGEIQLYEYHYFSNSVNRITGQVIGEPRLVKVYLRGDPRKNDVPVDGKINIVSDTVYVSINGTGLDCEDSNIALAGLSSFLTQNGVHLQGAVVDSEEALEYDLEQVTCETYPDSTVIVVQSGDKPFIQTKNNCYILQISDCDVLSTTEKFIVQSIIDARERAQQS